MATVICMIAVLTTLAVALIQQVTDESNRAAASVKADGVYQAAEAGINDYIAKLLDDPQFYDHYVANGESTRRECTAFSSGTCTSPGATLGHGSTWTAGRGWTYPNGKDWWFGGIGGTYGNSTVLRGYAYNLMIAPPSTVLGTNYITIVSTGCKVVDPYATTLQCDSKVPQRAVEVRVRRATPADFQYIWGDDQAWGQTATTYGVVYVIGNICHDGTAYGALEATGNINTTGACGSPAPTVSRPTNAPMYTTVPQTNPATQALSLVVKPGAIDFSKFQVSLTDIKSAATLSGMKFDNASVGAWRLAFQSNGTVSVYQCTRKNGADPASQQPTCGTQVTGSPFTLPSNGAIYTGQTAIISWPSNPPGDSIINGRVTVASNVNIVIGGNIHYYSESGYGAGPNDDVLGLIANNYVYVANWVPTHLTWRAAVLAENGARRSYSCPNDGDGPLQQADFTGSVASHMSGCMTEFQVRNYYADPVLSYLFPPWFPVIDGAETTVLFHEVKANYIPQTG